MPYNLLIDFGATRTKTAIADKRTLLDIKQGSSLPFTTRNKKEISVKKLLKNFKDILIDYSKNYDVKNVITSCQMHGFALQNGKGDFITDYISWQDERAFMPYKGVSSFEIFAKAFPDYKDLSGMYLRGCFPVVKVLDFLRKNKLKQVKILSLAEIFDLLGKSKNKVHFTMAQASGCFDFKKREFSKEIINFIKHETGCVVLFNEPCEEIETSSELNIKGKRCNILSGVGDHQASIVGALGFDCKKISINIGTGSQISQISTKISKKLENRFFFHGKILNTVTHIPAGRVVARYIDFLNEYSRLNYWDMLDSLTVKEVFNADLKFNLALFRDAFNLNKDIAGSIHNITTDNFNKRNFLASMLKSFIFQYVDLLKYLDSKQDIIISGGKLAKNQLVQYVLSKCSERKITISKTQEEALKGLALISKESI